VWPPPPASCPSVSTRTVFQTNATHDTCQAPPATVFLHALHDQMPIECRLTVFLPQNEHAVAASALCTQTTKSPPLTVFRVLGDFHFLDLLS
jgi:hypothetical protein